MTPDKKLWFRAKRYGYGWYPASKEGWFVIAVYVVFFALAEIAFLRFALPRHSVPGTIAYFAFVILITGILIRIASKKGEPGRWRWGKDN